MLSLATVIILLSALISTVWGEKFTNPLRKKDGSDPWITFNNADKYYYLLTTTWKDVQITRARTLNGLKTGEKKVVYKDGNVNRCCNVWAPGRYCVEIKIGILLNLVLQNCTLSMEFGIFTSLLGKIKI